MDSRQEPADPLFWVGSRSRSAEGSAALVAFRVVSKPDRIEYPLQMIFDCRH